jgi:hypothetical protein
LSTRRPKWLAAWEMIALGTGIVFFLLYLQGAESNVVPYADHLHAWYTLPVGSTSWGTLVLWLGSFFALALLVIGIPLVMENREHWAKQSKPANRPR